MAYAVAMLRGEDHVLSCTSTKNLTEAATAIWKAALRTPWFDPNSGVAMQRLETAAIRYDLISHVVQTKNPKNGCILLLPWETRAQQGFTQFDFPRLFRSFPALYREPRDIQSRHFVVVVDATSWNDEPLVVCQNWHGDTPKGQFHIPLIQLTNMLRDGRASAWYLQ